jgi:hypothetical protein
MSRRNQSRFALMPGTRGYEKSTKGKLDKAAREKAKLELLGQAALDWVANGNNPLFAESVLGAARDYAKACKG